MKRWTAVLTIFVLLCGVLSGTTTFAAADIFAFDQTIGAFDKTTGEVIEAIGIPSGSKIGTAGNLAVWGTSNADKLNASVGPVEGSNGDAFQIHYTAKVGGDYQEFIRFDTVSVEYDAVTEQTPLVVEYRMKASFSDTATMNACIDFAPVIKPASGANVDGVPLVQQSLNAANNGKWLLVKYMITGIDHSGDKAVLTYERDIDGAKYSGTVTLGAGTGGDAKIVGLKLRPRARATTYLPGGSMDIAIDSLRLYLDEPAPVPTGTRWGDDLTVGGQYEHGNLASATVIGDKNTTAAYTLSNADASYTAKIDDNNTLFTVTNRSNDGYKSGLLPVDAQKWTAADVPENGAVVYEARYKINYTLNEAQTSSYSKVQMLFEFLRNSSQSLQFYVPANKAASGDWVTVKIMMPKAAMTGEGKPVVFVNDEMQSFNGTLDGIDQLKLKRVIFMNQNRSGQTAGDAPSETVFTLDYLDQYRLTEEGAFAVSTTDLADGDADVTAAPRTLRFTSNHIVDQTTLSSVALFKKGEGGTYIPVEPEGLYGAKSTGDKTFDVGFSAALEAGGEYRLDLTGVKDIYGNASGAHYTFRTALEYQWKQAELTWDGDDAKLSVTVINNTEAALNGTIFAAAYEGEELVAAASAAGAAAAGGENSCQLVLPDVGKNVKIRLYYWDANLRPYLMPNDVYSPPGN